MKMKPYAALSGCRPVVSATLFAGLTILATACSPPKTPTTTSLETSSVFQANLDDDINELDGDASTTTGNGGNMQFGAHVGTLQTNGTKKIPLSVQGVAKAGVSTRVKGIEIGGDVTVLDVSIAYSGFNSSIQMAAFGNAFIEDEQGLRLPLRSPDDNEHLTIQHKDVLQGQLVFLGHVPADTRQLRLVFNADQAVDSDLWPKLTIDLPLQEENVSLQEDAQ